MLVDLVAAPDKELEATYASVQRQGPPSSGKTMPSLRGNKGAHLLGSASFLCDSEGNVIGAIESVKDITERKKQEKKLKS
jgi:PAS domain-containing protein